MSDLLKNLPKIAVTEKAYRELPESAGIYVFFSGLVPIYIGKAINLRRRVSSYFDINLEGKTKMMVRDAERLSFIKVSSELEALLLEAKLIRTYLPKYNIAAKDDKHPLYIVITNEEFPRVLSARKLTAYGVALKASYGPFPSSRNVRVVLKMLRRIFPYSDHKIGKCPCIYSHMGLCNPCPNTISSLKDPDLKKEERVKYLKNIRHIKSILDGRIGIVRNEIAEEMTHSSKMQDFESAAKYRDQIHKLEYITRPQMPTEFYMQNPNLVEEVRNKELKELQRILAKFDPSHFPVSGISLRRIECFDVAHLAGANATASMVTFINGEADKNFYRHFKIRQKKGNSDTDSLKEVIGRRLKHLASWGKPDLIIVDGGKAQVSVFLRELERENISVVGLAKRFETLVIPVKSDGTVSLKEYRLPRGAALNLVQRIRDEAHRFARVYHHKLVSASLVNK